MAYTVHAGKGPVMVWQTEGGSTRATPGTGTVAGRAKLTVMQKRQGEWWPIGTVVVEPGGDQSEVPLTELRTPPDNDWRAFWRSSWFGGGGKRSGVIRFAQPVTDRTPEVVRLAKADIDRASSVFSSLRPTRGLTNPLGFCRLAYANWEQPSPVTAWNGIGVCNPDNQIFEKAVAFAVEAESSGWNKRMPVSAALADDLASLACGYYGGKYEYTPDPVDILCPMWASRGKGDCEDMAISVVAMLRCLDPSRYRRGTVVRAVADRVSAAWSNPRMVCGYVMLKQLTGHAWVGATIDGKLRHIESTEPFAFTQGLPNSVPLDRYRSVAFAFDPEAGYAATTKDGTVGVKVGVEPVWKSLAWKDANAEVAHTPTGISMSSTAICVDQVQS